MNRPLVTVITVALNARDLIEKTILSVAAQRYPDIEYIIIDGGSTDGTTDLIRHHSDHIAGWVSEKDEGISDAFNKGIAGAHGEFVGILNAGDWYEPETVSSVVDCFLQTGADIVYGDLRVWEEDGNTRVIQGREKGLKRRMTLQHPAVFVRRAAYERHGVFRRDFRLAMDYEWLLRARASGLTFVHLPKVVTHMAAGGASSQSWAKNRWEALRAKNMHSPGIVNYFYFVWQIVSAVSRRFVLEKVGLTRFVRWLQQKLSL